MTLPLIVDPSVDFCPLKPKMDDGQNHLPLIGFVLSRVKKIK
jgi:hypothetical protein